MELYVYYSIIVFGTIILSLYLYIIWIKTNERLMAKKLKKYEYQLIPLIDTLLSNIANSKHVNLLNKNSLVESVSKNKFKKSILENRIIYYLENRQFLSAPPLIKFCEELGIIDKEIKELSKNNFYAQALACKKLGELRSQKAIPHLLKQVRSSSPDVVYNALLALAHIGDSNAFLKAFEKINSSTILSERSLIEITDRFAGNKSEIYFPMLNDDNEFISCIFIKSAGSYKNDALAEKIALFLQTGSKEKKIAALKALGRMNNNKYIDNISTLLTNDNWEIRAIAAKILGQYQDISVIPKLIPLLSDEKWFVRYNAANSILALDKTLSSIHVVFEGTDPFAKDIILSAMENNNMLSLVLDANDSSRVFSEDTVRLIKNYIQKGGDSKSE